MLRWYQRHVGMRIKLAMMGFGDVPTRLALRMGRELVLVSFHLQSFRVLKRGGDLAYLPRAKLDPWRQSL